SPCFHYFLSYCSGRYRDLHSFPTRRSSDLFAPTAVDMATAAAQLAGFVAVANGAPDQERHRLFVALTHFCAALSDVQPLLLIVEDRKSTRLNSSHVAISYAVFCLKKKRKKN